MELNNRKRLKETGYTYAASIEYDDKAAEEYGTIRANLKKEDQ